jgi:hypothetical protein
VASASSKAQAEERTIVWVDESAFYPLPAVIRTWAPRSHTRLTRAAHARASVRHQRLAELRLELRLATARLRHKRAIIRGCITRCGFAV